MVNEDFLLRVEQLDGMPESLRHLLGAATAGDRADQHDESSSATTTTAEQEAERCERYGFTLSSPLKRRRIFWGSLIADDSWHVLGLASMEYYGMFDTIAFVESNTTQNMSPRSLRYPPGSDRKSLLTSHLLWGDRTRVHVDYFWANESSPSVYSNRELAREHDQREYILKRWKENGMSEDDIGFLSDVDEVANRDFLLALQVCNVPEFDPALANNNPPLPPDRPHDCLKCKLVASTIVFESSPKCMQVGRRWHHPDFIVGACIQGIGNDTLRDKEVVDPRSFANRRIDGWDKTHVRHIPWGPSHTNTTVPLGPLWSAADYRGLGYGTSGMVTGTRTHQNISYSLPTAYHFHNFFDSLSTLRRKYFTYGHPIATAWTVPLSDIHPEDVGFAVSCLAGRPPADAKRNRYRQPTLSDWNNLDPEYGTPIAFQKVPNYMTLRHEEFQRELVADERLHPPPQINATW